MTATAEQLRYASAKARRDSLNNAMALQFRVLDVVPVREHMFHPTRKWRFDFAFMASKLAVEVDGATYTGGRHTRGTGYAEDCRKVAEAMALGWRVLRVTGAHVKSGEALRWVEAILGNKAAS